MTDVLNRFAPDFSLSTLNGGRVSLIDTRGQVTVLIFWSAACRWSRRTDVMLVYRQLKWAPRGVRLIGVASNVNEAPAEMALEAENRGLKYPIGLDPNGLVCGQYGASVTPHFFVIDRSGLVRYSGAGDDATEERPRPTELFLDQAVAAVLDNQPIPIEHTPPYGCPIVRVKTPA